MPTTIITPGSPSFTPWGVRSYSATDADTALDAQIRALAELFEPHRARLYEIEQRIDALRTWGAEWDDYDAPPPSAPTVARAHEWIVRLYLDAYDLGRPWIDPLITASEEGEAMFEWQSDGRRLTIEVTEAGASFSKLWGVPPEFQFEDGSADTRSQRQRLWAWLVG